MAILESVETSYGEERELYIRVNNIEVNNHGAWDRALFRGYSSKSAFENKKHYMYEETVEFKSDVSGNLWSQAYTAFCEKLGIENNQV